VTGERALEGLRHLDEVAITRESSTYDLLICALSIENRCTKIPSMLHGAVAKKIALSICVMNGKSSASHRVLQSQGFEIIEFTEHFLSREIDICLRSPSAKKPGALSVFIDVTCIPRRILAQIIGTIRIQCSNIDVDLGIGYTLARYSPPPNRNPAPNKRVAPVHALFAGWTHSPGLATTTVVGLGYEKDKALGAVEYLQASDCFLFIPNSPEQKYRIKVDAHNRQLIDAVKQDRVWEYEVMRPAETLLTLGALIASIKQNAKPVLLPFGPKILFAVSLLAALVHPQAAVWHVSGEESEPITDKSAAAHTAGLRCLIKALPS
jgi:hypothetical protein